MWPWAATGTAPGQLQDGSWTAPGRLLAASWWRYCLAILSGSRVSLPFLAVLSGKAFLAILSGCPF